MRKLNLRTTSETSVDFYLFSDERCNIYMLEKSIKPGALGGKVPQPGLCPLSVWDLLGDVRLPPGGQCTS